MSEAPRTAADLPLPGGDFRLFVQRLGYQALIALGIVDNPVTGERSRALDRARSVLADLEMLDAKTSGNLEPDEAEHLREVVRSVRQHFDALDG